jgi:hypothetical protein
MHFSDHARKRLVLVLVTLVLDSWSSGPETWHEVGSSISGDSLGRGVAEKRLSSDLKGFGLA